MIKLWVVSENLSGYVGVLEKKRMADRSGCGSQTEDAGNLKDMFSLLKYFAQDRP